DLLTNPRRLEPLRGLVPDVFGIDRRAASRPAAYEIRAQHHGPHDEKTSPIVADQVDRPLESRELIDEPIGIGFLRRRKARRSRTAESRHPNPAHFPPPP